MSMIVRSTWPAERAWDWYRTLPWLCGFNYVPATAVNTTDFWQAEMFDAETIDRELTWAQTVGFNTCRVFLQYLVWDADPTGLIARFDRFLSIARVFQPEGIGCYAWGLVAGKTQTYFPWGSPPNAPEPGVWFHDLFRPDGTPYDQAEIECLRAHLANSES